MGFSRQEHWSGLPFLLQGSFATQGLNPGLPRCRQTLYWLSYQRRLSGEPLFLLGLLYTYLCNYFSLINFIYFIHSCFLLSQSHSSTWSSFCLNLYTFSANSYTLRLVILCLVIFICKVILAFSLCYPPGSVLGQLSPKSLHLPLSLPG